MPDHRILDHNQTAAAAWGAGGRAYDDVSYAISDALLHAAQRLAPGAGEQILDVATGTGWTARNVARAGASVSAVDIAPELLQAARELSRHVAPGIDFQVADAEKLPFADGRFDKVISTFGVMFAGDPASAARELGRVCRKDGRLCLATWAPDGSVAEFFAVLGRYSTAAPPESPLRWGDPNYLLELLGGDFALTFEPGINNAYFDDADHVWACYRDGFGPLRLLNDGLDDAGRRALKRDVDAYHDHYRVEAGLHVRREYLVTVGRRR